MNNIDETWKKVALKELYKENMLKFKEEILNNTLYYPSRENIFKVFRMPVNKVKIVLLGQDPYPTKGDAIGLSFINGTDKIPPSLKIIYKELENEGFANPDIKTWTEQGIFLLNSALTVESGRPGSHLLYWRDFTENIIKFLSKENPCVWVLLGKNAQSFKKCIFNPFTIKGYDKNTIEELPFKPDANYILEAPHPAAESYSGGKAGFYNSNIFLFANKILEKKNIKQIKY